MSRKEGIRGMIVKQIRIDEARNDGYLPRIVGVVKIMKE